MQGWVKLHRRIMQSETFARLNAIQQLIAIYIILNANHEDGIWYDKYKDIEVPIKRGQLITSRQKIMNEWFKGDKLVTEQKIRTTLTKLERLGFITTKPTNNYTLVEVLNYNVYQMKENESNQQNNQETTNKQPRDNQEITTNKNVKNDKNDKKKDYTSKIKDLLPVFSSINNFNELNRKYWDAIRETRKSGNIQPSVIYNTMKKWKNYELVVVEYSLKTHIEAHAGKREEYTIGIMRRTSVDEAQDRLNTINIKPHSKGNSVDWDAIAKEVEHEENGSIAIGTEN